MCHGLTNDLFICSTGVDPRILCLLSKHSVTELHLPFQMNYWCDEFDFNLMTQLVMLPKKKKKKRNNSTRQTFKHKSTKLNVISDLIHFMIRITFLNNSYITWLEIPKVHIFYQHKCFFTMYPRKKIT